MFRKTLDKLLQNRTKNESNKVVEIRFMSMLQSDSRETHHTFISLPLTLCSSTSQSTL